MFASAKFMRRKGIVQALGLAALFLLVYSTADATVVWRYTHIAPLAALLAPHDAALRFEIGNYYFGGGAYDLSKAEKYYRKALSLEPTLQGAHYQLARTHFIKGDFVAAEKEINKELELYPDFGRSYYVRGLIYGYSGQLAKAEADFKEFLAWKPNSWAGNNDLAWIYFQQGNYGGARDAAQAGLLVAPGNVWLLNSLGVSLLNLGDKKGAAEAFSMARDALALMTEEEWGLAYPGNDPRVYAEGFSQMRSSIESNLELLRSGDSTRAE